VSVAHDRSRWADAQRRRRERAKLRESVFRLALNENLVAAALLATDRGSAAALEDKETCERLLATWITEILLETVIDDCTGPPDPEFLGVRSRILRAPNGSG
jgi:hypothetical protein